MTDKKSQHILAIQQTLADFDIETQVRRITLQSLDSFMLGNKQAFTYIQEWSTKFLEFEARLVKAESYYRNIEMNVNAKIQVTNSLNERLGKFAEEFWASLKESEESLEQMRKNYMNLVKETGVQASSMRGFEKQLKEVHKKHDKIEDRLTDQTTKLTQQILQTQQSLTQKNLERRSQSQSILLKLTSAKAQLDSKAQLMHELSKDLSLYKTQKISLESQLAALHQELTGRVHRDQFNKIRVYIDNCTNVSAGRIQEVYGELKGKIEEEVGVRAREIGEGVVERGKIREELEREIRAVDGVMQEKFGKVAEEIKQLDAKIAKNHRELQKSISENSQQIQTTQTSIQQFTQKFQLLDSDLVDKQNRLLQAQSNILSINALLKSLEQESNKRGEELTRLKVQTSDKNDVGEKIGEQVGKLAESLIGVGEELRRLGERVAGVQGRVEGLGVESGRRIGEVERDARERLGELERKYEGAVQALADSLDSRCSQIQLQISTNHSSLLTQFQTTLTQKIDSIRDKFLFLETLNSQMQLFKKTFQEQLQMNDQLNKEVKQKMDRMFGMFTKLKSDAFLKIQVLGAEVGKLGGKGKESARVLGELLVLVSGWNEIFTVGLAVELWREWAQAGEAAEEYKIASVIEGWVLELAKDKAKYRGEPTTKRALIQLCLEHHVKIGDKIKGGLIENGKDVFLRMAGGSEEYQQLRRRSVSRKKQRQSELPKVYR